MTDLPPPSYEQTIEAITRCDIATTAVQIKYVDYLQSDEITISHLGTITEDKLRCLKNSVHPAYILTIKDMAQRETFYDFSEREDGPKQRSDALDWLKAKGMLDRLPAFTPGQKLEDFAVAVELACDLKAGSALMVSDDSWISIQPGAISIESYEKSSRDLECLLKMFAASEAYENGVKFGFIGNAPE